MKYIDINARSITYELGVINFLLNAGKITREEASYLRSYLETIV